MAMRGTADRYGTLAVAIHWVAALATLAQLGLGFAVAAAGDDAHRIALLQFHAPLGVLILALTAIRLVWWLFDRRPRNPAGQSRWQSFAAWTVQRLMVVITILAGVSGMGLLVRSGANLIVFGAAPGPLSDFTQYFQRYVHGAATFALAVLLVVHVAAALHHQFVRRDGVFGRIGLGA
jgi:cytochrome b561